MNLNTKRMQVSVISKCILYFVTSYLHMLENNCLNFKKQNEPTKKNKKKMKYFAKKACINAYQYEKPFAIMADTRLTVRSY